MISLRLLGIQKKEASSINPALLSKVLIKVLIKRNIGIKK